MLPDIFHSKSSNVKEELCEGTYEFRSGFKKCFVGKMLELYFMKRLEISSGFFVDLG